MNSLSKSVFLFALFLCHSVMLFSEISTYKTYKVIEKDTLYSISKKFKISESEIFHLNGKQISENLKIGQILKFPIQKKETVKFNNPLNKKIKIEKKFSELSQFPHKGILFSISKNPEVLSAKEGKIQICDYLEGYENYIIISHPKGYYSLYANLSEIYVSEGQKVTVNEKIGKLPTGKGLYFQINNHSKPMDPEIFLN